MKNTIETNGLFLEKHMGLSSCRDIDNIKNILKKEKEINTSETVFSIMSSDNLYKEFTKDSFISNLYNTLRYIYISEMDDCFLEDFEEQDKIFKINLIKEKIESTLPNTKNLSDWVLQEIIVNYDSDKKNDMILAYDKKHIYPMLNDDEKIAFLKERVDKLYTRKQRFKSMLSGINAMPKKIGIPFGIIGIPGVITYSVFGESGLLKGFKYVNLLTERFETKTDKVLDKIDNVLKSIKNKF